MLDALVKPIEEASGVLERVAARDLTVLMEGTYEGDFVRMKESLNTAVTNLDEALSEVRVGTEHVGHAADEIMNSAPDG